MGNRPVETRRLALKRVQSALFHLPFEDRVKVLVTTLKTIGIKASDLKEITDDSADKD
jgi:23S rRNA C2498 (ribose-2'-O)-methylase RlmM